MSSNSKQNTQQLTKLHTYLKTGNKLKSEGKLNRAIEQYQKALQLNTDFLPALKQLVAIHEQRNELDKVILYRQRVIKLQPGNLNLFRQLMGVYTKIFSRNNDVEEVISTYQSLLADTPSEYVPIVHESFGQVLLKLGVRNGILDRIIAFFQEAIETQPEQPWFHYYLGLSFARQDRLDEAISCYENSIQLQPSFWQALAENGIALRAKGKRKQGFQYFVQSLLTNPNLPLTYYLSSCDPNSAEEWNLLKRTHEEISDKTKQQHILDYALGDKLSQQGQLSEASECFQKSIYCQLKQSKPEYVSQFWGNSKLLEPDFIIIGVAKCGTTALYDYISQHPQFLQPVKKEPRYLRSVLPKIKKLDNLKDKLLDERDCYLAHFPPRPDDKKFFTGEASTSNIILSGVDTILSSWFPNIKLIAILRDPVKRAISYYNFILKMGRPKLSLNLALTKEMNALTERLCLSKNLKNIKANNIVATGLYVYYLERWMQVFQKEQFLILSNEELARDPAGIMKQVFNFIGVSECRSIKYIPKNVGHYPKDVDPDLLSRLQEFYRPHNQRLEEFLGRKFNWD